jgi:hypothetical protein
MLAAVATLIFTLGGCEKSGNPAAPAGSGVPVNLMVSFSKSARGLSLFKSADDGDRGFVDSIRVDSVVVVVADITFRPDADSISMNHEGDNHGEDRGDDARLTFRGPFVIHVRDTLAIDFASQLLPAGKYNRVTFHIRRLMPGEGHEDSDEHANHGLRDDDSSVVGSSVIICGAVKKNGTWSGFTLLEDLDLEFMIKGDFVVQEATGTVNIAFNFNLEMWFRDPESGAVLDPANTSGETREAIVRAIRFAFGQGRGGHDHDHDGHPDD